MSKGVLLSFTGFHDPYGDSPLEGAKDAGPILQMLASRPFSHVYLFQTPKLVERTRQTVQEINKRFPDVSVGVKALDKLDDPTDHIRILRYLRCFVREILADIPKADLSVSISSGTPSMHACWLLLAAEGTLPARLLYGHPVRVVGQDGRISEVNLDAPEFPHVTAYGRQAADDAREYVPDLAGIREELSIIGDAPAFIAALERVARLAGYDEHILLLGETGTGKEEVAQLIHRLSRRSGPFVPVNCSAIPEALAESVLFGHTKGSFTGAQGDQDGEFVNADGGTLFLDEVGDMPMDIQAKLLRVLQDGQVKPVGAKASRKINVRVVAATNADLKKAIREGTFRADLAQRFIDTVDLPPLRDRREDILTLALYALQKWNTQYGGDKKLSREALVAMQGYHWPGNVREVLSTVKRAAMLSRGKRILPEDLRLGEASWLEGQSNAMAVPEPHEGFDINAYFSEQREKLFNRALDMANGNKTKAAALLSVSPQAVHKFTTTKHEDGQTQVENLPT